MARERLQAAKELITAKKYGAARELLNTIPDDPTAQRWLAKLNEIEGYVSPKPKPVVPRQVSVVATPPRTSFGQKVLYFVVAVIVLAIIGSFLPDRPSARQSSNTVATQPASAQMRFEPLPTLELPTFRFYSESEGLQPVLGPVDFPTGVYTARVITNGYFILHVTTVSGICEGGFGGTLFNVIRNTADERVEALFTSIDCRALLEISNTQEEWTLSFRPIE